MWPSKLSKWEKKSLQPANEVKPPWRQGSKEYVLFYSAHMIRLFLFIGVRKKSPQLSIVEKKLPWNGDTPQDKVCLGSPISPHAPLPTWSACSCSCISNFWIRDAASLWLLSSSWASCSCICSVGWWRRRATPAVTHLVCSLRCWPTLMCSPKMELGKKHIHMPWY